MQRLSHDIRVNWTRKIAEIDLPGIGTMIMSIANPNPDVDPETFCTNLRRVAQNYIDRGRHQTIARMDAPTNPEVETTQQYDLPGNLPDFNPRTSTLSRNKLEEMLKDFKSKMSKQ